MVHYLTPEQLLRLSPWRPPEADLSGYEGRSWHCPNCMEDRIFGAFLVRLEAVPRRLLVQCPQCDHMAVIRIQDLPRPELITEYGGPHVAAFTAYLDRSTQDD